MREERTDLVLNQTDGLGAAPDGVALVFVDPEASHLDIRDAIRHSSAIRVVVQEAQNVRQRGAGHLHESEKGVAERMFQTRSPGISPELLEHVEQSRRGERTYRRKTTRERIEGEGRLGIRQVEVHDPFPLGRRNPRKKCLGQIAVRIEEREAPAVNEILTHEGLKERRLAGSGLTDQLHARRRSLSSGRGTFARSRQAQPADFRTSHGGPLKAGASN